MMDPFRIEIGSMIIPVFRVRYERMKFDIEDNERIGSCIRIACYI